MDSNYCRDGVFLHWVEMVVIHSTDSFHPVDGKDKVGVIMGSMKNLDIRILISEKGLKHKDIAKEMGITPEWLSRLLRYDCNRSDRERILKAIELLEEPTTDCGLIGKILGGQ